ncbi:unnamed protein product, partial [Rotaria magnacalcarata]
ASIYIYSTLSLVPFVENSLSLFNIHLGQYFECCLDKSLQLLKFECMQNGPRKNKVSCINKNKTRLASQ